MILTGNRKRNLRGKMRVMKLPMPGVYRSWGRKCNKAARRRRKHWDSDYWNTLRYRYDGTIRNA
jgi:hypothetical protein